MSESATKIKTLYPYQERDINIIFQKLETAPTGFQLLYQLPTGGGKTVVFSEIAKRYLERYNQKVLILTHRTELCNQTSSTLKKRGVRNKIINSNTNSIRAGNFDCYVAMVETLRNRIKTQKVNTTDIGLVIIDEAHHNSFRKLLGNFKDAFVIGVTATPFSADINLPMNDYYSDLVVGENIPSLIAGGFLAKPEYYSYEVELNTLQKGIHGDYTVSSSNELYSSPAMLELLLKSYQNHAKNKKSMIFNNGIETSLLVCKLFNDAGFAAKHLDNKTPAAERKEILKWYHQTKGAILTSVSILTTGFDEPTVQTVILNRATTSLTLYHQMVGRGSRRLPAKKTFRIIDLGNNAERFGEWQHPVDWKFVFEHPREYAEQLSYIAAGHSAVQSHSMSAELRAKFPNTLELTFDIENALAKAESEGKKSKTVIQNSIRQQALMCVENSETASGALELAEALHPETEWRVKQYIKGLEKTTTSYKAWLIEDYKLRLNTLITKLYARNITVEH